MTLQTLLDSYSQKQISNDKFKQEIQQGINNKLFDESNVVNSIYTSQFGFPSIKTIANTTGISQNNVQNILHSNNVYINLKNHFQLVKIILEQ
jgi:hypothetical protein